MGISFEHMGVDFRHCEFILASGSQFWVSGIRFCNSGSQFWPVMWVHFWPPGFDFRPLRADFGPLKVDFGLLGSIMGL